MVSQVWALPTSGNTRAHRFCQRLPDPDCACDLAALLSFWGLPLDTSADTGRL